MKKNSTKLDFGLDFYTDVLDLEYLLELLDDGPFTKKYKKLNAALVGLVEDYSLVSFVPLNVKSEKSLLQLKSAVDKVRTISLNIPILFIVHTHFYRQMVTFMEVVKKEVFKHFYHVQWEQEQKLRDMMLIICNLFLYVSNKN